MSPVLTEGHKTAFEATTFHAEMLDYIKRHFSDALGEDVALLDVPGGLDALAAKLHERARSFPRR